MSCLPLYRKDVNELNVMIFNFSSDVFIYNLNKATYISYSRFWLSYLGSLVYCSQTLLNRLSFQSLCIDRTRWRLLQKRVVRTEFDIYLFIIEKKEK